MNKTASTCIIVARNMSATTVLEKYENILAGDYDIIYCDNWNLDEKCDAQNIFRFIPLANANKRSVKIKNYVRFRRFIKNVLKTHKYNRLIVITTQTAVIMADVLLGKYKRSYLLDIRDYTAENNKLFKALMTKLIDNSAVASLTSPAYKTFLPEADYVITHNYARIEDRFIKEYRETHSVSKAPVIISCIGGIRFIGFFQKIIDRFKNDPRFQLQFIGNGAFNLKEYCEQNNISNVYLEERFRKEETLAKHMGADMENNLFGHGTPLLDYALSNRLYYGVQLGIPVLACKGTYTAEIINKYGLGFVFDEDDDKAVDKLWEYYSNLDRNRLYEACAIFMSEIRNDEDEWQSRMRGQLVMTQDQPAPSSVSKQVPDSRFGTETGHSLRLDK